MNALTVDDLSVFREGPDSPALRHLSETFAAGEVTAVAGENGSGKTSLALVLAGVLPRIVGGSWTGAVACGGVALRPSGWPDPIAAAYSSQDHSSHVILGSLADILLGMPEDLVGLARSLPLPSPRTEVQHLSTGQRHLVDWLLCQGRRPTIMIMDEGLSSMDRETAGLLLAGSRELEGNSERVLILIDQDRDRLANHADRIVVLAAPIPRELPLAEARARGRALEAICAVEGREAAVGGPPVPLTAWWPRSQQRFEADAFRLEPGLCVLVQGRVGTGKSTLLKALAGYPGPRRDRRLQEIHKTWQPFYLGTADHFVTAYPTIRSALNRFLDVERAGAAWAALSGLLPGKGPETDPGTLSFGQRRLVAILSVVASARRAVVLDEPDKGLDPWAQELVVGLLMGFLAAGGAVVVTTHNPGFVARLRLAFPPHSLRSVGVRPA